MSIILRLDWVMADRKISSKELSKNVGLAKANLSHIRTGKVRSIRFSTLNALCEALKCQPGDLMRYKDDDEE